MIQRIMVIGMLAVCLVTGGPGWAEVPSVETAQVEPWQALMQEGQALSDEAALITRADHNPRTRDYFRAAELYMASANAYERARILLNQTAPGQEAVSPEAQAEAHTLAKTVKRIRFQAFQNKAVAERRFRRNML